MRLLKNLKAAVQVLISLPGRTALLALPVAISTALALATLAIDRGLADRAEAAARSFGQDVISIRSGTRVIAGQSGTVGTLTDDDVEALRVQLKEVRGVEGTRIEDNVPMSYQGKNGVYRIFAVRPPWAGIRQFGAERGEFIDDADVQSSARVSIIGQTVARELFGQQDPIGAELIVNQVPFRVKGVLVPKGASPAEGDRDARIVIPITTFYDRLYRRIHLDQIVVQVSGTDGEIMSRVEADIKRILRERHAIPEGQADDFAVRLPDLIAEQSRGISRSIVFLLLGLAILCAFVAGAAITVVFGQAVRARKAEIGVRRALGATSADILWQIWGEGFVVSIVGGMAGFALGVVAAEWLTSSRDLAFRFAPLVILIPMGLILLSSLAGLIPARMAAKLDPAVALRPSA
jgi:putative ABC transport system permease protein